MKALRFVWALVFLLAAGCLLFAFWFGDMPAAGETPPVVSVAGPAEISPPIPSLSVPSAPPRFDDSSDALLALTEIEARHPIFVLDGFLEDCDEVRNTYLRAFHPDPSVDSAAEAIHAAVEGGTRKFILDLRGNGGGNSEVGAQLLHAMGMTLPGYGVYIRNSGKTKEALAQQVGLETDTDPVFFPPDPSTASNPLGIKLVVLTDEKTFSSATMTAIWVRDGKLGTLIGRPSSNAPCAFGDMTTVKLPVCGVTLTVSYKRFLRPDAGADPNILLPDILTGRGEDAMQAALAYLDGK